MRDKITTNTGFIGGVTFELIGPAYVNEAIIKFIKNLTRVTNGMDKNNK